MSHDDVFQIFMGTWIVLGLATFAIFFLSNDAKLKRKLWPYFVVGGGVLFVGFMLAMGFRGEALYVMVPAIIVISVLSLRSTKFCDSCGKTIINQNFLVKPKFCVKCGAPLV